MRLPKTFETNSVIIKKSESIIKAAVVMPLFGCLHICQYKRVVEQNGKDFVFLVFVVEDDDDRENEENEKIEDEEGKKTWPNTIEHTVN